MWKERLKQAREDGLEAVRAAERELGDLRNVEGGILVDLFLSYHTLGGYSDPTVTPLDGMRLTNNA